MTKMTETEKQMRRESVIHQGLSLQRESVREWHQVLIALDAPVGFRIACLTEIRDDIDRMIDDLLRSTL